MRVLRSRHFRIALFVALVVPSPTAAAPDPVDGVERERGRREAQPGQELRSATQGYRLLREQLPDFYEAWAEFPRRPRPTWDLIHRFFWILQEVEGRPTVVLSHAMAGLRDGRALVAERQFYVARSYNVSETVWGGLPAESGSFVYYHNRTSTDQVAGAGGSVRKTIGRRVMQTRCCVSSRACAGPSTRTPPQRPPRRPLAATR